MSHVQSPQDDQDKGSPEHRAGRLPSLPTGLRWLIAALAGAFGILSPLIAIEQPFKVRGAAAVFLVIGFLLLMWIAWEVYRQKQVKRFGRADLSLIVLGTFFVVTMITLSPDAPAPQANGPAVDSSPQQSTPSSPAPPARLATVKYTEGHGVNTFLGPSNTYPRGNPANITEGQIVAIVCQERNGQAIHDPEGDPARFKDPWPVWDKLSIGLWIPDLYTDLPKEPGEGPPGEIPTC